MTISRESLLTPEAYAKVRQSMRQKVMSTRKTGRSAWELTFCCYLRNN